MCEKIGLMLASLGQLFAGSVAAQNATDGVPAGNGPQAAAPGGDPAPSQEDSEAAAMAAFEASLKWQTGQVSLGDGEASLQLADGFRFLDTREADRVLQAWGNPPDDTHRGLWMPDGVGVFEDASYAVVINFTEDGYVDDEDAAELDYAELLADMKEQTQEQNNARVEAGFGAVHLPGWAESPRQDSDAKRLYWARELNFEGSDTHTLNYAVRVLGHRGVLEMNAVASMPQMSTIKPAIETLMGSVLFNEGHRYADFDSDIDSVAAYGVGGLIAGKLAAKAGFFKVILAALLAGKKFVVFGVIALVAILRKVFSDRAPVEEEG